jgi:foldase protein PrsA
MDVTAAEVEAEIDRVALTLAGVDRETWLRTLAKDRNISPAQYARDIIYPQLALRKLATPRVQCTEQDLKDAFESQYGERLVYRMIVVRNLADANHMFNELQKNPGGFENMARNDDRSIDQATKPAGGKPLQPMARHSYPRDATDKVFRQLVDGDPDDKDPDHKPKDGDISGPIQIAEGAWILVKREGLIAAQPHDPNNPQQIQAMKNAIIESKLQQHMELMMGELVQSAEIENRLKGTIKHANQQVPATTPEQQRALAARAAEQEKVAQDAIQVPKSDGAVSVTAAQAAAAAKRKAGTPGTISEADKQLRAELGKNADAPLPPYDPTKDPDRQPPK